jgi:polysaccharide pyruvyl transferase WcaK-like protein
MKVIKICSLSGINTGDAIISKSIEYLMDINGVEIKVIDIENRSLLRLKEGEPVKKGLLFSLLNKSKLVRYCYKRLKYKYVILDKVLKECDDYDVVMFGGGNMFFNYIGCPYLYSFSLLSTRLKSKIQITYGVGVGPFSFPWKKELKTILENSNFMSVRDESSRLAVEGISDQYIHTFSDPALVLSDMAVWQDEAKLAGKFKKFFTINVMEYNTRFYPDVDQDLKELTSNLIDISLHFQLPIKIILTSREDLAINENIGRLLNSAGIDFEFLKTDTGTNFNDVYRGAEFSLCNRMHSAIFSYSFGIPTLVYPWQPKLVGMLETIAPHNVDDLSIDVNYNLKSVINQINSYPKLSVNEGVNATKKRIYAEARQVAALIKDQQVE